MSNKHKVSLLLAGFSDGPGRSRPGTAENQATLRVAKVGVPITHHAEFFH